jgi:hypothetical protein
MNSFINNYSIMKTSLLVLSVLSSIAEAKYFGIIDCRIFVDFIFYDLSEFKRYPTT